MLKQSLTILFLFSCITRVFGETFQWEAKGEKPSFTIDVPNDWERDHIITSNGAIVYFRESVALIEVRSFVTDYDPEFDALMNVKAARLSSMYKNVKLIYERKSRLRPEMYLAAWILTKKGRRFVEKTAFIVDGDYILAVSCIVPLKNYKKFRVVFDNAILSVQLLDKDGRPSDEILKLKKFFIFNRPNAQNKVEPPKID